MRSGTTLMSQALNAHPNIAIVPDHLTWFFKRCYKQFGNLNTDFEFDNMFYQMEPYMRHHKNNYSQLFLKKSILEAGSMSYENLYKTLVYILTKNKKSNFYGIKTTHAHSEYHKMLDYDKNTKIIHLVRDIHDVYSSHKRYVTKSFFGKLKALVSNAHRSSLTIDARYFNPIHFVKPYLILDAWCSMNSYALELSKIYPNNIKIIKYEDFISNPKNTLQAALNFLQVDWIEDFFNYSNIRASNPLWKANSSFKDLKKDSYDIRAIGRGKKLLNSSDIDLISTKCSDILKDLGY